MELLAGEQLYLERTSSADLFIDLIGLYGGTLLAKYPTYKSLLARQESDL